MLLLSTGRPGATIGQLGNAAMQNPDRRGIYSARAAKLAQAAKKRGSNRSWSLMIGPKPNLKFWPDAREEDMHQTGEPKPREEDTAQVRVA
jgi:hypothetical protein